MRLHYVTARFVYISDERSDGAWQDGTAGVPHVTWRVVAGNNRTLGRSAATFASLVACVEAATRLHREAGRADSSVLFDLTEGHWRWTVGLAGAPVALSTHAYQRRIECARSLEQFLAAVTHAEPAPERLRRLAAKPVRRDTGPAMLTIAAGSP